MLQTCSCKLIEVLLSTSSSDHGNYPIKVEGECRITTEKRRLQFTLDAKSKGLDAGKQEAGQRSDGQIQLVRRGGQSEGFPLFHRQRNPTRQQLGLFRNGRTCPRFQSFQLDFIVQQFVVFHFSSGTGRPAVGRDQSG